MANRTEKDLELVDDALWRADQAQIYEAVPDLPLVLRELEAWLDDEHQWRSGRARNWATLLQDLLESWAKMGSALRARFDAEASTARDEIQLVKRSLTQSNLPPDESMRRRLRRAAADLRERLLTDDALIDGWADLVSAGGPAGMNQAARLLAKIGELHGHSTRSLTWEIRQVRRDDVYAVFRARGHSTDSIQEGEGQADASVAERLKLVENVLTRLPRKADVIVWLFFSLAPAMQPPVQRVGEGVTLYDLAWLHRAEEEPSSAAYRIPAELTVEPLVGVSWIAGNRGKASDDNDVPYVAARVELQNVWVAEAEEMARASAEALIALASLEGGHVCPWILEDSFSMFVDGIDGPSSHSAPAVFRPTSDQRTAMSRDWTAEVIRRNAERWGPHFPIRDPRMTEAAHLLVWLRKARETWGPARLILCDRVIERVAGWAGFSSPRRLMNDYLKYHWAIVAMRSECGNVGWAALNAGDSARAGRTRDQYEEQERWKEEIRLDPDLEFDSGERYWYVNARSVLRKLEWLEIRVPPRNRIAERISELKARTATGRAAAEWAEKEMREFSRMDARAKRVRNALVHGGPATEQAAEEIVPFVESLAEMALYTSVEGRLDEVDLVDHFLNMRASHLHVLDELKGGMSPADALWLGADEA